jgi:hypothetical protein
MAEEKYLVLPLDALPFPLMHTDLGQKNILVDNDINITGYEILILLVNIPQLSVYRILDWDDLACRLPLQCAMTCPALIVVGNDPLHDALFSEDRMSFIDHFASAIRSSSLLDHIAVHLPSMENDELQIFQSSIGSKGIYAYWVKKYCICSTQWVEAAIRALDKFVLTHPEMACLSFSVCVHLLEMQKEGMAPPAIRGFSVTGL